MASRERKEIADLGEQAIALAEQLGRIAGTVEGTAEAWLTRQNLTEQLARVRDGANEMLKALAAGAERARGVTARRVRLQPDSVPAKKKAAASSRPADLSHAPGKRHRKPAPTLRGAKKSNQVVPKLRTAKAMRQRRKSYA
jgi:hypothetical protein